MKEGEKIKTTKGKKEIHLYKLPKIKELMLKKKKIKNNDLKKKKNKKLKK